MSVFRIKWHWIAGGAFVTLFALLLAFRLDLFGERVSARQEHDTPSYVQECRDRDVWMSISQKGQKIGYAHRRFFRTERGYRFVESVFMRINTMGIVQGIRFKTEGDLHPDMSLSSFNFHLNSSLFSFTAHGVVKERRLTLYSGTPGSLKKTEIPLPETPYLTNGILESVWSAGLKAGQQRTFHVFDPATMGQRPVKVSLLGDDMVTIMDRRQKAQKWAVDFMGVQQFAWIGEDGSILREDGILGITLEAVTKKQALEDLALSSSADLTEIASIAADKTIAAPEKLTELEVKLINCGDSSLFLNGGRQRLKDNILTIHRESMATLPFRSEVIGGNEAFLEATPFIQSDHPQIQAMAGKIVSPHDPVTVKARKLVAWVHKNLEKRPVLSVPNALETLNNLVGDCNEHAVLLAALARAAGIPAQVEAGLVYQRGRFYYHAWNALFLGRWVTADAVMGQMPADVTHIRFVRGTTEQQIDLISVIGKIRLKILSTSS
ncbi:MAG: transglutaminase-like domain-containing protein [Syntrophales bacterium]|nr:transglutaminase-like domain-containing protein [Syntrophales bacterium]